MKNPLNAYGAIASLYEYLMDVDYDEWAEYVRSLISPYLIGNVGVDAGCGSGAFTRRFKRAGLNVIGMDISPEMLAVAERKAKDEGLNILYVLSDMRKMKVNSKVDFITAITDCMNYIPKEDVEKTFKRFASCLKKGGVLAFDVSTEYKLKNIIGNNMFGEDGEDFSYLWFNTLTNVGVEMEISAFIRDKGDFFIKKEERHVQYFHSEEELKKALGNAGFDLKKTEGHLGKKIDDKTERLNFVAVKR